MTPAELLALSHAAALEELTNPVERLVRAALRRCFTTALARMGIQAAVPAHHSFSPDDLAGIRTSWRQAVEDELLPAIAEIYGTGALAALLGFPTATDAASALLGPGQTIAQVVDERGVEYLAQATNRLVGIGDTAWTEARTTLTEGMAAGEPVEQLTERLLHTLDVTENRAVTIARTEVVSASNAGSIDAVRLLGGEGPTHKQWMATLGPRTREWHAEADGQTVPVGDTFEVGGEQLDYPGDPAGSAENVINCRCTVIYVDDPEATIAPDGREQGGNLAASGAAPTEGSSLTPMPRIVLPTRGASATRRATPPARRALVAAMPAPIDHPVYGLVYPFTTLLTVEGRWTGDGRLIQPDALVWEGMLPFALTSTHDDDPEVTIGVVDTITRAPGAVPTERLVTGSGFLDANHPLVAGNDETPGLARQVAEGFVRGVSIDLDAIVPGAIDPATLPPGVLPEEADWLFAVVDSGRIRALAVTSLPAFPEAFFTLGDAAPDAAALPPAVDGPDPLPPVEPTPVDTGAPAAVAMPETTPVTVIAASSAFRVVAAQPVLEDCPPREWFADPQLDGPTPVTVTDDGYVFGHLALWGVCHTGSSGECVLAPHSRNGYASFLVGEEVCDNGERVPVGGLTVNTGHAHELALARPAAAHYDDTGTRVANVTVGEDRHGVWIAGAVTSYATPEQVHVLRSVPLSGDWRLIGTDLELVAALGVNAPGFPVPRIGIAASGRQVSLVAAGVVDRAEFTGVLPRSAIDRIAASIGRDYTTRARAAYARVHG